MKAEIAALKHILFFFIPVFCTASTLLPSLAAAQTPGSPALPDSIKNYALKEISIKAQQISLSSASPVPVQVLTERDLRRTASFSVADAVRYLSGVQLKDYGGVGGLKTVNVRSLGSNHTAVFFDGMQLGNAQNGQVDLGKFSLDHLEEIALFNGQNPELLQTARAYGSASSMYLKPKEPRFSANKRYNAGLTLRSGSFGLFNPSGSLDLKLGPRVFSRISTEVIESNGRYRFRYTNGVYDTTAIRNNGDLSAFRLEALVQGKTDSGEWRVRFYHYGSERGLPRAIVSNRFNASQRLWDDNNFVQASFRRKITPNYSVLLQGKLASDDTRFLDPEFITTKGFLDNRYKQKEYYVSLANEYRITPFWQLALSADYQRYTLDANIYRFAYPTRNTALVAVASNLQFEKFSMQASLLGTFVNERVKEYTAADDQREYTPTVMFNWKPFNDRALRLRGFYKSIFRMPTFNDLYYTFVGKTDLRPEYTRQYNLGLVFSKSLKGRLFDFINAQADVYYNTVRGKIVAVPGANLFRWAMTNLDEVQIKGLETTIKASKRASADLNLSAALTYTYQQALDVTPGAFNYRQQIPYSPVHSGSFIASATYREHSLNYSFIYTGERYSQKANIPVNYVEPWYTHDVSAQYKLRLWKQDLLARLEVHNLLNQYYDVILNFPMPGRNYRISLSYKL